MLGLPDHTILDKHKHLFDGISTLVTTIFKYVLWTRLSKDVPVSGKILGRGILDSLLVVCLPVLAVLLALGTYLSFLIISSPACWQ